MVSRRDRRRDQVVFALCFQVSFCVEPGGIWFGKPIPIRAIAAVMLNVFTMGFNRKQSLKDWLTVVTMTLLLLENLEKLVVLVMINRISSPWVELSFHGYSLHSGKYIIHDNCVRSVLRGRRDKGCPRGASNSSNILSCHEQSVRQLTHSRG